MLGWIGQFDLLQHLYGKNITYNYNDFYSNNSELNLFNSVENPSILLQKNNFDNLNFVFDFFSFKMDENTENEDDIVTQDIKLNVLVPIIGLIVNAY